MNLIFPAVFATVIFALTGCAVTTPVNDLGLPPVSAIEGSVVQSDQNGFTLRDASGAIFVSAKLPDGNSLGLSQKEIVTVYGNLRGGRERIFDAYVIKKSSGEQIIVDRPTPHFGCVVQSAFE